MAAQDVVGVPCERGLSPATTRLSLRGCLRDVDHHAVEEQSEADVMRDVLDGAFNCCASARRDVSFEHRADTVEDLANEGLGHVGVLSMMPTEERHPDDVQSCGCTAASACSFPRAGFVDAPQAVRAVLGGASTFHVGVF